MDLYPVNINKDLFFYLRKIKIYLDCIRAKEVFLIGGVTFIGLVFSTNTFNIDTTLKWILAMVTAYSLLSHSFLSNDWSGYEYDKKDVNKSRRPLMRGEVSLKEVKILSIFFLIISLTTALLLSYYTFYMAVGVIVLNYLYSGNSVFLKSVPVVSSGLHFLGATLGFLIGYTFNGNIDVNGILFGMYFGIIYATGHLNHEITDMDSDENAGITTSANSFGKKKIFLLSFILFSLSFIYIIFLSLLGTLPFYLIYGVIISYSAYLYFFTRTFKSKLDYNSMISFRRSYRIIFLLWGVFLVTSIVLYRI